MASGEYVVGRDIDFQYADSAPAADADVSAGARKKSKKKTKKKKQNSSEQASDTAEQENQTSQARIEPLTPQKQSSGPANRPDAAPPSPASTSQSKALPPREKRRVASSKLGKRPSSLNSATDSTPTSTPQAQGTPSAVAHRHKPAPHTQQEHRHLDYTPEKDSDVWLVCSNEEKERIRQFWRHLSQQEREDLARLDKDMLFQRIRRQRRDCTCTVCGRQREAVEEELEELYTMNYDKLKQFSARLLEGEALFSDEKSSSSASGDVEGPTLRRRRRAIESYRDHLAHAHTSPTARKGSSSTRITNSEGTSQPDGTSETPQLQQQAPKDEPQQHEAELELLQEQLQQELHRSRDSPQLEHEQLADLHGQHHDNHGECGFAIQQTNNVPFKNRHPIEMLYTQLVPSSSGGPPRPLLAEIAKAYKNLPMPDNARLSPEEALEQSALSAGEPVDPWKRVTKTFQDLVLDHLMKSSPGGDPKALDDSQVLETLDKVVLADSQVLDILDKVVRAGRVDPGSLAGGIMGLADDLLRNDGKQFMNMYEEQQVQPGAQQVLQPLKQLYDNYRMAEGPSGSAQFLPPGSVNNDGALGPLRGGPGFNLTVRVDADAPLHGEHEPEDDEDEFEDAVEEELEYGDEEDDALDDELDEELEDYTDGYSELEATVTGDTMNELAEYDRKETWEESDVANAEVSEKRRLMEGYSMLRTFTARVFEQRVLQAYREQVARERQQLLLQELAEEESRAAKERELRKTKDKEKKKNKKALAKQQREEEQRLKQAEQERYREEQRLKDEQRRLQQLELDRVKQEAHRRKIEERMARMELESREREAEERKRNLERLRLEKERTEKEEQAQREQLEKSERERREREAALRDALERERSEKENAERKRKQRDKERQDKLQRERVRLDKERQSTPKQMTPRQAPPGLANPDGTPKFAVPQISSPFGYPLQGLQAGLRGPNASNHPGQQPMAKQAVAMNPPGLQGGNTSDLHHISSTPFQQNPAGLQAAPNLHSMSGLPPGPSSTLPSQPIQPLSSLQHSQQSQLQGGFPSILSQASPKLSNLWSTVPQKQQQPQQPQQQLQAQQPQPQQQQSQQQAQKWNSWSPWTATASDGRSTPDLGRTPSPQYHAPSPWSGGASMWATTRSSDLEDIRKAAQRCYVTIVRDGLGDDGFVPGQVLYHATLDAAGGRFSQNDLYKALAQLPSFECLRDDVGLITHVRIQLS